MDEQKRLLLTVLLSILILAGYQYFFVKPPSDVTAPSQEVADRNIDPPENRNISDYSPDRVLQEEKIDPVGPEEEDYRNISVSTPLYRISVSEKRAAVKSFELKTYRDRKEKDSLFKQMVPGYFSEGTLFFDLEGQTVRGLKDALYTAGTDEDEISVFEGEKSIEFSWTTSQGIVVKKIFTFKADSYLIDCDIVFQNGSGMPLEDSIVISVPGFFNEDVRKRSRFAFEGPVAFIDEEFTKIDPDDIEDKDTFNGTIQWAGYTDRYFITSIIPENPVKGRLKLSYEDDIVTNDFIIKTGRIDPGKQMQYSFAYYIGPKSYSILGKYDNNLKKAVYFGWFDVIAKPLLIIMNYIHKIIPNYGIAIIILTIIIKIIFWPLGTKSYKSMNEMKKIQPLMMEIREKYSQDKQRMNKEIIGLYKTYKVNPASGCLPLLVQMPIFFALYRMLYQAIELRHASFLGWISDLSAPDRLFNFNFSIPMMQEPYGIPVLTILMGASFLLQQKMAPPAGDPMQTKIMMLMPIFMTVIFINFPAGLVLYMFVNNIISMGQQYYIQRKFS